MTDSSFLYFSFLLNKNFLLSIPLIVLFLSAQSNSLLFLFVFHYINYTIPTPPNLNNSLALIHPTLYLYFFTHKDRFSGSLKAILLLLTIFFGSWWAHQELNWGGYWNWDIIETSSLLFFVLLLIWIHTNYSTKAYTCIWSDKLWFYWLIFIWLKIHPISSVHSFVQPEQSASQLPHLFFLKFLSFLKPITDFHFYKTILLTTFLLFFVKSILGVLKLLISKKKIIDVLHYSSFLPLIIVFIKWPRTYLLFPQKKEKN